MCHPGVGVGMDGWGRGGEEEWKEIESDAFRRNHRNIDIEHPLGENPAVQRGQTTSGERGRKKATGRAKAFPGIRWEGVGKRPKAEAKATGTGVKKRAILL